MAYIQGEGRHQGTLFPVTLDDLVPADHVCHVIDAFVEMLAMSELRFERSQAAETGRPGYDPRDLLKLYPYGYLNQIRSSRRLEAERLLMRGLSGAKVEIGLATMAYNLKRITNVLGATKLASCRIEQGEGITNSNVENVVEISCVPPSRSLDLSIVTTSNRSAPVRQRL